MSVWPHLPELSVQWRASTGRLHLAGALVFEWRMIFAEAHTPKTRERVLIAIDRIRALIPDEAFRWFWSREGKRPTRRRGALPSAANVLANAPEAGEAFNYLITDCEDPYFDAPRHFLKVRFQDRARSDADSLGSLHLRLPLAWVKAGREQRAIDLFLELSELLKPRFGSAGLALSAPIHAGGKQMRAAYEAYPMLTRFLALDSGEASYAAATIAHFNNNPDAPVTTINWLTMVDHQLMSSCEGNALAAAVFDAPEFSIFPLASGTVIRAGASPQMGDVTQPANGLAAYARVATFLRPVRMLSSLSVNPAFAPEGANVHLDRYEAAQIKYLTRFDP